MKPKILLALCITVVMTSSQNLSAQSWNLTGNAATNPSTNFLGTTDNKDFVIRTKNTERLRVNSNGNIGINYTGAPVAALDLRNSKQINSLYLNNTSTNTNQYGVRAFVNGTNANALRTGGEFSAQG